MVTKTKAIVTVAAFLSSTGMAFAAGKPYVGASLGVGGLHSQVGAIANIFGGYGSTFDFKQQKFYLGGELDLHVGNYAYTHDRVTAGLGVALMPGIMLSDSTLLYAKLGLDSTYASHYRTLYFGTQVGVGLQTALTRNIDIRGEYTTTRVSDSGQYSVGLVYKFE